MKPVWIGCSGWSYDDWRGTFYPRGLARSRWLEHYGGVFGTVEVNNTFYRLPSREAVSRWAEATPDGFVFTVKASRFLTHMKRMRDLGEPMQRFYDRIEPLSEAEKLGPVLWQLPERQRRDDELLASALARLPDGRHGFEFRHPSWFERDVYRLLGSHGAALVIGDHPERPFQSLELTTDWTLIRLHYGARGRDGNYSRRELDIWRRRIAAWRSRVEVYAYFNNDWRGFAPRNARYLQRGLSPAT
jgi:uncharacterized protein YecE (DUF72 family)